MIKCFWKGRNPDDFVNQQFDLKVEVTKELETWKLRTIKKEELCKLVEKKLKEKIVEEITERIQCDYSSILQDKIVKEMLKDDEISKIIKETYINHAYNLLNKPMRS